MQNGHSFFLIECMYFTFFMASDLFWFYYSYTCVYSSIYKYEILSLYNILFTHIYTHITSGPITWYWTNNLHVLSMGRLFYLDLSIPLLCVVLCLGLDSHDIPPSMFVQLLMLFFLQSCLATHVLQTSRMQNCWHF